MNQQQQSAIAYLSGPCLVLAGAGSGKTRVITHKISWLIKECAYDARRVVALTFTNKAAREMSQRLKALIDTRLTKGLDRKSTRLNSSRVPISYDVYNLTIK